MRARRTQVELDSIQDYVAESDNLVALQVQIRGCDGILDKMESLLGGFQSDLGKISSEARAACSPRARDRLLTAAPVAQIKSLQEQSFTMSMKLRNRKAAEAQLGQFVEDISVPPKLISAIVDGEVRALPSRAMAACRVSLRCPEHVHTGQRGVRAELGAAAHEAGVHRHRPQGAACALGRCICHARAQRAFLSRAAARLGRRSRRPRCRTLSRSLSGCASRRLRR